MHLMAPIIAAVTYLHHQQPPIIHGDIKPANIIIAQGMQRGRACRFWHDESM